VAVLIVLVRRHCRAVGAAVRRAVGDKGFRFSSDLGTGPTAARGCAKAPVFCLLSLYAIGNQIWRSWMMSLLASKPFRFSRHPEQSTVHEAHNGPQRPKQRAHVIHRSLAWPQSTANYFFFFFPSDGAAPPKSASRQFWQPFLLAALYFFLQSFRQQEHT